MKPCHSLGAAREAAVRVSSSWITAVPLDEVAQLELGRILGTWDNRQTGNRRGRFNENRRVEGRSPDK